MTLSRRSLIVLEDTEHYHCFSRCVRRAFLCGLDSLSNHSYEHRRKWVEDRLLHIATLFTIQIVAYAIMSNHYHVVLRVNRRQAADLSAQDVINRWGALFSLDPLCLRFLKHEPLTEEEQRQVNKLVEAWRARLASISWFMRSINEPIARQANQEDNVTGRFWEGRFKSQALLDEAAVVSCMAYVDLNPVRAGAAPTPEESAHTSAAKRIEALEQKTPLHPALMPMQNTPEPSPESAPIDIVSYLELLDHTGRAFRENKAGAIAPTELPILARLNINPAHWLDTVCRFVYKFKRFVGRYQTGREVCERHGLSRLSGAGACRMAFAL